MKGRFPKSRALVAFRVNYDMPINRPLQTRANHVKFDPAFHFVILPLVLSFLVMSVILLFREPSLLTAALSVLAVALVPMALLVRMYPLKAQDRIIRLEEQLRMASVLPEDLRPPSLHLESGQYVALRFASDAELAALVRTTLAENLTGKQIKERVADWRPDHNRI